MVTYELFFKLVGIIGFILLILAIILIGKNPSLGYEVSIYSATSPIVWVSLIGSIFCGFFIIVYQLFTAKKSSFWLVGLFILALSSFVIIFLHILRGYAIYDFDDVSTHVGLVKDITLTGFISSRDIYPISHILGAILSLMCHISPIRAISLLPSFYWILFVFGVYMLSDFIFHESKYQILSTSASTVLLYSYYNFYIKPIPWGLSVLIYPFFLYLYLRKSINYRVLFIIFIFMVPFFHPVLAFFSIISLIFIELVKMFYKIKVRLPENSYQTNHKLIFSLSLNAPLLIFIIFFLWLWRVNWFWKRNIVHIISSLEGVITSSPLKEVVNKIVYAGNLGYNVKIFFLRTFGHVLIFLIILIVSIILIIKRFRKDSSLRNLFVLTSVPISASFLTFILLRPVIKLNFGRVFVFIFVAAPIYLGFLLYELLKKCQTRRSRQFLTGFIMSIMLISSIIGIFSTYGSPYLYTYNRQVTKMDISGFKWALDYKDTRVDVLSIRSTIYRYAHMIYGIKYVKETERKDLRESLLNNPETIPIDHFGYLDHQTYGETIVPGDYVGKYSPDRYLLLPKIDRMIYLEVWEKPNRFEKSDFDKLNQDSTLFKIYSNGEFNAWYVKAKNI